MYRYLAEFYPKKLRQNYVNLLRYASVKVNANRFIGFTAVFGVLLALNMAFYLGLFFGVPFIISFVVSFLLIEFTIYYWLMLRADAKARFVESILPDVLQLMASNLRAGLTTDKALLSSARPEFGPFQDEITRVGKEITTGEEIGKALMNMTEHIRSERLKKTMALIVSGLKSGGEMASLLEQTARNLMQERLVDSRIRANVMMYVIFIFAALCIGAPLLFGLSSFLVEVITINLKAVEIPETTAMGGLPMSFSQVNITPDFVVRFSVIFLITASFLGSLILGLISKGKEREGIKYIPMLLIISLAVFFLARFAMRNMIGGLFGS